MLLGRLGLLGAETNVSMPIQLRSPRPWTGTEVAAVQGFRGGCGGDFQLATSGDHELAVDRRARRVAPHFLLEGGIDQASSVDLDNFAK